jgi:polysaccharide export outer membrane protein
MKVLGCLALIFCVTTSLFAQRESLLIGPGDELHVQVFDTPELDYAARVTDEGELPLILGGSVKVASLTPSEAASVIENALIAAKVMHHPRVLVTVEQYATQNVTVSGQVVKPGAYQITTARSITDVLALAGGLTDLADRHVTVQRASGGPQETVFISNDSSGDAKRSTLVYPGDSVTVPKAGFVYVLGDVARPGGYPMTNNESTLTVLQAVALAGGTANTAVPSHAKLIRRGSVGYSSISLQLSEMQTGKKPDLPMQASDIVYVPFSYLRNAALGLTGILSSATSAVIYTKP